MARTKVKDKPEPHPIVLRPWRDVVTRSYDPKAGYPRAPTAINVWRRTQKEVIQAETKKRAEAEGTPKERILPLPGELVAKEMYNRLSEEEQKRWKAQAEEEHKQAIKPWEDSVRPSDDPRIRQQYIESITDVIKPFIQYMSKSTGWNVTFIGGGPEPAHGGRLNVISVHEGHVLGEPDSNFGVVEREGYKDHFLKTYSRFLRNCFTKEECRAMALPVETGLEVHPGGFRILSGAQVEVESASVDSATAALAGAILRSRIKAAIDVTVDPIAFEPSEDEDSDDEEQVDSMDVDDFISLPRFNNLSLPGPSSVLETQAEPAISATLAPDVQPSTTSASTPNASNPAIDHPAPASVPVPSLSITIAEPSTSPSPSPSPVPNIDIDMEMPISSVRTSASALSPTPIPASGPTQASGAGNANALDPDRLMDLALSFMTGAGIEPQGQAAAAAATSASSNASSTSSSNTGVQNGGGSQQSQKSSSLSNSSQSPVILAASAAAAAGAPNSVAAGNSQSNAQKENSSQSQPRSVAPPDPPSSSSSPSSLSSSQTPASDNSNSNLDTSTRAVASPQVVSPMYIDPAPAAAHSKSMPSSNSSTSTSKPTSSSTPVPAPSRARTSKLKAKAKASARRGNQYPFLQLQPVASSSKTMLDLSRSSSPIASLTSSSLSSSSPSANTSTLTSRSSRSYETATSQSAPEPEPEPLDLSEARIIETIELSENCTKFVLAFDDEYDLSATPAPPAGLEVPKLVITCPTPSPPRDISPPRDVVEPIFRLITPLLRQVISGDDRLKVPPRSFKRQLKAVVVPAPADTKEKANSGTGSGGEAQKEKDGDGQKEKDGGSQTQTQTQSSQTRSEVWSQATQGLDARVAASRLIDKAAESLKLMSSKSNQNHNAPGNSRTTSPPQAPAQVLTVPTPAVAMPQADAPVSFRPQDAGRDNRTNTASDKSQPSPKSTSASTAPEHNGPSTEVDSEPPQPSDGNANSQTSQGEPLNSPAQAQGLTGRSGSRAGQAKSTAPRQPAQPQPESRRSSRRKVIPASASNGDDFYQDDVPMNVDSHLASSLGDSADVEMAPAPHDDAVKGRSPVRRSKRKRASSIITASAKAAAESKETSSSGSRQSKRLRMSNSLAEPMSISAPLPRPSPSKSSRRANRGRSSMGASTAPKAPGKVLSVLAADSSAPQYFKNAIQMFTSPAQESFGPRWTSLVSMWSSFEVGASYEETRGLGKAHRPQVIGDWIARARAATWRPNITNGDPDLKKYEAQFRSWWVSLQPEWRVLDSNKGELAREVDDDDDESRDLDELKLAGKNGIVSVLAALFYWGLAVNDKNPKAKPRQKWLEAVEDCHWVFEQIARDLD